MSHNLLRVVIKQSLIPLNSLLLFFLLFEARIVLPDWLQVFGRMHPLALHFPIVLILLYAVMMLFFPSRLRKEQWFVSATDSLLLAAAFTASITALMGFALAGGGEDYDSESLSLHKWTGVIIPFVLHFLYALRKNLLNNVKAARVASVALTIFISVAGHHGAVITHGENFILAPLTPVSQRILPAFEDAYVYTDMVEPIFENKCFGCHNSRKSKGDLVMDTRELFLKGGEEGIPWDTTRKDLGILMQRLHMPLEEKKHMPPKGKPQLTDDEMFVIHEWIKRGSDFEARFIDLLPDDTLYKIGKAKLLSGTEENYDFAAADESTIQKLNNNYRIISPIAAESPALSATFYNKATFSISAVKDLEPIFNNVVELNLSGMPVKDEDVAAFSRFKNLRQLNLNFSEITGKTLDQLKTLPELKSISLSGTAVELADLRKLQEFPKLKDVYIWNTPASDSKLDGLKEKNKNIAWYAGYKGDTVVLQLTPPLIQNEERIIDGSADLKIKHYINGTEVRYTLDGRIPDSTTSLVYKPGTKVDSGVTIKAKAFKPGWISSEVAQYHFYKKSFVPDSIEILTSPHIKYRGHMGITLNDNVMSEPETLSGKWVGFDKNRFEAVLYFNETVKPSSVTISMLNDPGGWIFPPKKVEIWGGDNVGNMKLLKTYSPIQPTEYIAKKIEPLRCNFPTTAVRYMKVVAYPVILPAWHFEKGKNGYFFTDEIFVN